MTSDLGAGDATSEAHDLRVAVVIPVYNHGRTVRKVACDAIALGFPLFVVNDGSVDETGDALRELEGATVIHHEVNLGKGAALLTGMRAAFAEGARWALTLDADGQHAPQDAASLLEALQTAQCASLVIGCREGMGSSDVPLSSRFGRAFSNFWVWMAGGPWVRDSQSGFRVYPLPETLNLPIVSRHFEFEVEVLALAHRAGVTVVEAPVQVDYAPPGGRVSHFQPWRDFWRNAATFARLIVRRLFGPPVPHLHDRARSDVS